MTYFCGNCFQLRILVSIIVGQIVDNGFMTNRSVYNKCVTKVFDIVHDLRCSTTVHLP